MNRYRKLVFFICFVSLVSNIPGESVINCFILHDTLNRKPAGKMICGNFIELGFAHQIDGLWNQKLRNASFEVVNPYTEPVWGWLGRKPGDDMSTESWWHSGYEENPCSDSQVDLQVSVIVEYLKDTNEWYKLVLIPR